MKTLIIFVSVFVASFLLVSGDSKFEEIDKKCAEELGLDPNGNYTLEDKELKCYVTCIYTEFGVVDEKGDLDMPKFEEFMNHNYTHEEKASIRDCETKHRNSDRCEQVATTQDCIRESLSQ